MQRSVGIELQDVQILGTNFSAVSTTTTTIVSCLRSHAKTQPDTMAFRFLGDGERESASITFARLDEQARQIARQLQTFEVTGERVLLLLPQDLRFIVAFFGCLYARVVPVPMAVPRPKRSMSIMLAIARNARPAVILTTRELQSYLEAHLASELPDVIWQCMEDINTSPNDWMPDSPKRDELAFLQYTSGSTSMPKGVMVSHANLVHNVESMRQAFSISDQTIYGGWLPSYHDMGLIGIVLAPAFFGVTSVLMPALSFLQKPVRWLRLISAYRVTVSGGPNFSYEMCVDRIPAEHRTDLDLTSWCVAFNGSETVRAGTIGRFCAAFHDNGFAAHAMYPCYGMAEATLFVSGPACHSEVAVSASATGDVDENNSALSVQNKKNAHFVSCGHGWNGTVIHIIDPETRCPVSEGSVGEIWIESESVARGYFELEELSTETFKVPLGEGSDQYCLRSGDLGFIRDGRLHITGRLKDMIIIRGRNYYPQDIEETVGQCSEHLQRGACAAFAWENTGEERLVIVQELKRSGMDGNHLQLSLAIQQAISAEHGLSVHAIVLVRPVTIPKTSSGKIRRSACRNLFIEDELSTVYKYTGPARSA